MVGWVDWSELVSGIALESNSCTWKNFWNHSLWRKMGWNWKRVWLCLTRLQGWLHYCASHDFHSFFPVKSMFARHFEGREVWATRGCKILLMYWLQNGLSNLGGLLILPWHYRIYLQWFPKKLAVDFLFLDPELQPNRHKWLPMSWSRRVVSQLKLTPVVGKPWKTTSFGQISNSWPPFSLSTARNWYAWNKHLHVRRLHWKVAAEWHVSLPWIWNLLLEAHLKFVVYQRSHCFRGLNPKKWIISRIQPFGHHNYMVPCCFSRCSVRKKIPAGLQDELHREAVQREEALKRLETKLREAQLHSAAWWNTLMTPLGHSLGVGP